MFTVLDPLLEFTYHLLFRWRKFALCIQSLLCMLFLFGWPPCQRSDMILMEVSQHAYDMIHYISGLFGYFSVCAIYVNLIWYLYLFMLNKFCLSLSLKCRKWFTDVSNSSRTNRRSFWTYLQVLYRSIIRPVLMAPGQVLVCQHAATTAMARSQCGHQSGCLARYAAATEHLWTMRTTTRCPVRLMSSALNLDAERKLFRVMLRGRVWSPFDVTVFNRCPRSP